MGFEAREETVDPATNPPEISSPLQRVWRNRNEGINDQKTDQSMEQMEGGKRERENGWMEGKPGIV